MTIEKTLKERGSNYGPYLDNASLTQDLMDCILNHPNFSELGSDHRETIHMIFHKISRIVNGDPDFIDSWHDIEGYARLQTELCKNRKEFDDVTNS